jgi:tetrahydromethanopterin S-methyltransferase subunit G
MKYSILDESSSFDKVLSRLEKITERVNENNNDAANKLEARVDDTDKRDTSDYREKLQALSKRVGNKPRPSRLSIPAPAAPAIKPRKTRVKGNDFEVELVLSMSLQVDEPPILSPSKKAANDIIWRAYATTKSFGAIIAGVVATQAVARRWLTVRRVREEMNDRIHKVTRIKAVWRGYCCKKRFGKAVNGTLLYNR